MAGSSPPDDERPRESGASLPPDATPQLCLERARLRLDSGDRLEALALLERAHGLDPDDARCCSWLGLLLAEERGQLRRGFDLCAAALERDSEDPEHFMNLARVHLKMGQKREAIDVLRDGMRRHPESETLIGALVTLGIRKPLPFGSLARSHPLNKYTGLFLARIGLR